MSTQQQVFDMLTSEKARGGIVSLSTGIAANLMNVALIAGGANPVFTTIITLQVFGNLLTYFLDIMVAKREFLGASLSYTAYASRFRWFLHSLAGPPFYKYIIACILEAIIVFAGMRRARSFCDARQIHFQYRDGLLAALIATVSFLLVMNVLRFNWVLNEQDSLTLDVVVLAWMGLSALMLLLTPMKVADTQFIAV